MKWLSALALPGIVPVQDGSYADPSYFSIDEVVVSPPPSGDGSLWHFPLVSRSEHCARAWKQRGWSTLAVSGSVQLVQQDSGTLLYALIAAVSISAELTISGGDTPDPVSFAEWAKFDEQTPTRDPEPDPGYPGSNLLGNVTTTAGSAPLNLNLNWITPLRFTTEIQRESTGVSIYDLGNAEYVTPDFLLSATFYGNSGFIRDDDGSYLSVIEIELTAEWVVDGGSGDYRVSDEPDAATYYLPIPASSTTYWRNYDESLWGEYVGTATFDGGTDLTYSGDVPIRDVTNPSLSGGVMPVQTLDLIFDDAFYWTNPSAL